MPDEDDALKQLRGMAALCDAHVTTFTDGVGIFAAFYAIDGRTEAWCFDQDNGLAYRSSHEWVQWAAMQVQREQLHLSRAELLIFGGGHILIE
jgi:hypothetical protein